MEHKRHVKQNWIVAYTLTLIALLVLLPNLMLDGHKLADKEQIYPSQHDHMIHGIDVSRHNGSINWDEVSSHTRVDGKLQFAIIKATEGGDLIDPNFETNWAEAKKHGLVRGAYHFFATSTDPHTQAINYLATVKHESGDFVPVLDFENDGRSHAERDKLSENANTWLKVVEEQVGKKPIIYTNHLVYNKYIKNKIEGYDIWLADYSMYNPKVYDIENLLMWQLSDGGVVSGISTTVDLNVFYGTDHKFQKYLLK